MGRVIFGASVINCRRVISSPSCASRVIYVACPLVNGCNVASRSCRAGILAVNKLVIERCGSLPSGFECAGALSRILRRCGVPNVDKISAEGVAHVVHSRNDRGIVVATTSAPLRRTVRGVGTCGVPASVISHISYGGH